MTAHLRALVIHSSVKTYYRIIENLYKLEIYILFVIFSLHYFWRFIMFDNGVSWISQDEMIFFLGSKDWLRLQEMLWIDILDAFWIMRKVLLHLNDTICLKISRWQLFKSTEKKLIIKKIRHFLQRILFFVRVLSSFNFFLKFLLNLFFFFLF